MEQLQKLVDEKRNKATELGKLLDDNDLGLAADPTRVVGPPLREAVGPPVDFAPLTSVAARLKSAAQAHDAAYARLTGGQIRLSGAQRVQLNELLQGMEQKLTDARGLPGRDWFRHFIYAPGMLTGYGVKTLPAVREAVDGNRWEEANQYVGVTAQVLSVYCAGIEQATALLSHAS